MAADFLFQVFPASGLPIYRQLVDQVRRHVASGRLTPGDFLPSVRQVAIELEVNHMTVSKAYSLLERDGLVELVRGQGMRVNNRPDNAGPETLRDRQEQLAPIARQLVAAAYQLSLNEKQLRQLLDRVLKEFNGK
ncbi:MAG TPA: GntR family transcriptional regulator [Pirellulales bacterium]|jgi:GntR family transcriptional regulator|nr:GntR family transcriptional regulator [Pirellulales bacterium]